MSQAERLYPCCGDNTCPYCYGNGVVSDADPGIRAFYEALDKLCASMDQDTNTNTRED